MQIAEELAEQGLGGKRMIANVLDGLAALAADEISLGEDFIVPGIAKIAYTYTPARKKGESYRKGESYVGFGGVEQVAEADSKPRKEKIRLSARPTGAVGRLKPGTKPEAQSAFMKTKAAKNVKARKK